MTLIRPFLRSIADRCRAFGREEGGVTAVEVGLLAFPFFGMLAGILQTAVVFLASNVLESAVNDASRALRTGQAQASNMTSAQFRADICGRTAGLLADCSGLHIRVNTVVDFASSTLTPPAVTNCAKGCQWDNSTPQTFAPGKGKSVVVAQVFYRYPVIIPLVGMATLPDGSRLIGSVAVFQNEPFTW